MARRMVVVGNWKMNGWVETAQELTHSIITGLKEHHHRSDPCEVVLCPPATCLYPVSRCLEGSMVRLGGQNLSEFDHGPHTGEICGTMLRNVGCWYVIVGHSERRSGCGEDNERVARKMAAAFRDGLQPIVCVGETLDERDQGRALEVVREQMEGLFPLVPHSDQRQSLVIAYEPVWAIGTGRNASLEQIQEMHGLIRHVLCTRLGEDGERIRILYGGSVKPANAKAIFALEDVDGGLIGGASLNSSDFLAIIAAVPDRS
ncbi:MAG: triose-phosphate isomerase [Magnetococcales bacterium]|nr:triose-phosphate isomerase [Magnetococcales bacterium]NGZ06213.1 triose-phosphate isomerase [Magnetococcales bacterium]